MDDYGKPDAVAAQGIGAVQKTPDMAQQQFMSPVNTHPDVSAQPDVNTPLDINIPPVANTPPGRVQPQNSDQAPYQIQIQNRLPPCYQNQPQYYNPLPPPPYSGGPEGDTHSRQYVDVHYPGQYGYPPAYTPYGQPAGSGESDGVDGAWNYRACFFLDVRSGDRLHPLRDCRPNSRRQRPQNASPRPRKGAGHGRHGLFHHRPGPVGADNRLGLY